MALIASVQKGETINVKTRTRINHQSWMCPVYRWYYGENRKLTLRFIDNVLDNIHTLSPRDRDEVIRGLTNLFETYRGDPSSEFHILALRLKILGWRSEKEELGVD